MKITFKDVGQGDSVILEWFDKKKNYRVGIIDCNLKGRSNPVVNHIEKSQPEMIDFIILSHPHKDHYSGMLELLDHVEKNNIKVLQFAHTLKGIGTLYWRWFEKNTSDLKLLIKIVRKLKILKEKDLIVRIQPLVENVHINLSENIRIVCLAPSHDEIEKYQETVKYRPEKNITKASAAANHLSSILKLNFRGKYALFTSDAEKTTFERVIKQHDLKDKKFLACQLPHHGSKRNHSPIFWDKIETSKDHKNVFISSGTHHQYHHPDYETVKWFYDKGFSIRATNIVYGMKKLKAILTQKTIMFDEISLIESEYFIRGDQTINL
jgi:beta-lactamase superfamily II metal-dependent hydrolase